MRPPRHLLFALTVAAASPVAAQVPMVGRFVAEATCAATPSIRDPANPGDVATEAGESYALIGRNAVPGSHYLIVLPGAEPERRWVAYGCGRIEDGGGAGSGTASRGESTGAGQDDAYVLAASWHPAFCETRPRLDECRGGGSDDAGFSLHGLWPQPRGREYCGVASSVRMIDEAGDWSALPRLDLSGATRNRLTTAMPGVIAGLDRHEWWKHGTCFDGDAEAYFQISLELLDELNDSAVRDLFEDALGRQLSAQEIRVAFDNAFGSGAGARVLVDCIETGGQRLIGELRIELMGRPGDGLAAMIAAADTVEPGCGSGLVDANGS